MIELLRSFAMWCLPSPRVQEPQPWRPASEWIDADGIRNALQSTEGVVVHFGAAWSNTNRMMDALLARALREESFDALCVHVLDVDLEANHNFCRELEISTLPTVVFFSMGAERDRLIACRTYATLVSILHGWNELARST